MHRFKLLFIAILFIVPFFGQLIPVHAVDVGTVTANCRWASARGNTTVYAPYVRVAVHRVSDFQLLGSKVVAVWQGRFSASLRFNPQPNGTRLVIVVGEWDGQQYVQPAELLAYDCGINQPMPAPSVSPTFVPTSAGTLPPIWTMTPSPFVTVSATPLSPTPVPSRTPTRVGSVSPTPIWTVTPSPVVTISATPLSPTPIPSRTPTRVGTVPPPTSIPGFTPTFVPSAVSTLPPATPTAQYP